MHIQTLEFSFPGYGPEMSRGWSLYDNQGRVLLLDAPDNPSTSMVNGVESAAVIFERYHLVDIKKIWVYDSYRNDRCWILNDEYTFPGTEETDRTTADQAFLDQAIEWIKKTGWQPPQ